MSNFPKLGILGGGQLGKMLCQAASSWHLPVYVLDRDESFPAAPYATVFQRGDFRDYDDVMAFARGLDVVTIEIEHIDTRALHELEQAGVKVYPQPDKIDLIKDKGLQKQFYADHGIATTDFRLFADKEEVIQAVKEGDLHPPFVQKTRTGGYDGQGVSVIRYREEVPANLLEGPCLVETMADIDKELAVIVARSANGEVKVFNTVEMEFHPTANLVEFLICPAALDGDTDGRASKLAVEVVQKMEIVGLLAVELFLTKDGELLVNEVAPRPHNSGHHTIEACATSQYEQHLRAILGLPLGDPRLLRPAALINLLGAEGHTGPTRYQGWMDVLAIPEVYPHLYGKADTRPFRKMGHLTALGDTVAEARERAGRAKSLLQIVAAE
ncbi:5-(carboxyamino)imidazole ribonucleotide synthase [Lewinella marina]|uniref:N5-carboxyaminoimidazole ribonucleotide synthase n=1 Tax=Neolewinella marina TaxID=438751 RepID=A0A2G0CBA1_9BACT|nr:5-(carboxyamino)imidazole ribonucleotide synthase [Neolewinella marina]NJB87759.1 5-(carboxyamino)imidazole ribonucleotide synthase [Neolewinella marina]PHK97230.1 5-(carboxyamino)imidazole ribonucleotide synthase [Neolewinella marina]